MNEMTATVAEDKPAAPVAIPPDIAAAICKVMAKVRTLGKTEKNKFDNYDFVSVDKFFEAVAPLAADAGLAILHQEADHEYYTNKKDSLWMRVAFEFYLCHQSGATAGPFRRCVAVPMNGAQSYGSAQSYAIKQFLRGIFLIPTGDADDADFNAKDEHQAAPRQRQRAAPDPGRAVAAIEKAGSAKALFAALGDMPPEMIEQPAVQDAAAARFVTMIGKMTPEQLAKVTFPDWALGRDDVQTALAAKETPPAEPERADNGEEAYRASANRIMSDIAEQTDAGGVEATLELWEETLAEMKEAAPTLYAEVQAKADERREALAEGEA